MIIDHILTSEGRIRKEGSVYNFEYFIKDHLGNVRVVFGDDGNGNAELLQEDHYYPYGMTMGGLSYNAGIPHNKYQYNGKEIQADHNLDWYAYGFRMMDPQLGRWHVVDAMAENNTSASPYAYVQNNPVNYIDLLGLYMLGIDKHESGGGIWQVNYNFGSSPAFSTAINGYQGGSIYFSGPSGADYDSYVEKQENGEIGSNVTFTDWYNNNQGYGGTVSADPVNWGHGVEGDVVLVNVTISGEIDQESWADIFGFLIGDYPSFFAEQKLIFDFNYIIGSTGGGGNFANDGITFYEAATGVSAIGFANDVKRSILEWGMQGANWGKTGARYMKVVRGTGLVGSVFGMGVSGYNIYSNYSQGGIDAVIGWDVADFGVGLTGVTASTLVAVGLLSNPVGWVIAGGATIYFGARFIYDISTKP